MTRRSTRRVDEVEPRPRPRSTRRHSRTATPSSASSHGQGRSREGGDGSIRRDAVAAQALEQWLLRLRETFADRVLPIDEDIAERWGALNVPDPVPAVDGLLAATALVHDLTVVTRNVRDMERTGVRLFNPFGG